MHHHPVEPTGWEYAMQEEEIYPIIDIKLGLVDYETPAIRNKGNEEVITFRV